MDYGPRLAACQMAHMSAAGFARPDSDGRRSANAAASASTSVASGSALANHVSIDRGFDLAFTVVEPRR